MTLLFNDRLQFKSSVQTIPLQGNPGTEEKDPPPRVSDQAVTGTALDQLGEPVRAVDGHPLTDKLGHACAPRSVADAVASLTDEELSELIGLAIKLYDEGILDPANRAEVIRNYNARKTAS